MPEEVDGQVEASLVDDRMGSADWTRSEVCWGRFGQEDGSVPSEEVDDENRLAEWVWKGTSAKSMRRTVFGGIGSIRSAAQHG